MKRIIDNKRVEMTNDEYELYKNICRSYDRPNFKGEELFKEHFDSNQHGIIVFVKPPANRYSSLEVYTFLVSLMVNQHLRLSQEQNATLIKETSSKIQELIDDNKKLKDEVDEALKALKDTDKK